MKKSIVIVGGGYLGSTVAKNLDRHADVTLIEQRSHFAHASALIRSIAVPKMLDQALIPYDNLLKNGKTIHAKAIAVDSEGVILENGSKINADYIVVATGSDNALPFKPKGSNIDQFRQEHDRIHKLLKDAQSVAIVGGGPVGVELAGEIAHFMPDKKISLISSQLALFPEKPRKFGLGLEQKLRSVGVELILGHRVEQLEHTDMPYRGALKLESGEEVHADLIFPTIGSRAVSNLLTDLPGSKRSKANRVAVDPWLRPSEYANVFAAGDVADNGDEMTIVAIVRQAPWLTKTLKSLLKGKPIDSVKPYTPWSAKSPIVVPIGPKLGNSFLGLFTTGNWLTSKLKGGDMVSKYNKNFGRQLS